MTRPSKNEYNERYESYILLVETDDIIAEMKNQLDALREFFGKISEEKSLTTYEAGKWTIKEVVGHLIDGERIFAYRALRISRADKTPLEGFEQDDYVKNSNFNRIKFTDLIDELLLSRQANIIFFSNLTEAAWLRMGTASDFPVSVRALAFSMVGHINHHLRILRERYLSE